MNVKQRFDKTIQEIEKRAGDPYVDSQKLAEDVAASNALLVRDMVTVFKFLTGNTLRAYISDRKMMASYKFLITGTVRNIEGALEIAGYSDQANYTRAFKKRFGLAPGEAYKKKDTALYEEPLTWEMISKDIKEPVVEAAPVTPEPATHFGIKLDQYDKVAQAMELEAFYDFSPVFSQFAFDLSERINKSLQDTFKFVDALREYLWNAKPEDGSASDPPKTLEDELHEYGDDPFYQQMFFEKGIGLSTIEHFQFNHGATREELLNCNEDMLAAFSETYEMSFHYFMKAWQAFMEYTKGDYNPELFDAFVERLDSNIPIELALDEIPFDIIANSYPNDYDSVDAAWDLYYDEVDEVLEKAYNQWDGSRIDEEPDMDNLGYQDDEDSEEYIEDAISIEEMLFD